jgi:hypothetical protein
MEECFQEVYGKLVRRIILKWILEKYDGTYGMDSSGSE